MPARIEDYALIGDFQSAALVARGGSIDWLCLPRFDSDACFAALLGDERNGRWQIAPRGGMRAVRRRYRPDTLVLETTFETEDGVVRLIDCMPPRRGEPNVVRVVEGLSGSVPMRMDLRIRFGYGRALPEIRRNDDGVTALAGPDALSLYSGPAVMVAEEEATISADFQVCAGGKAPFVLIWHPPDQVPSPAIDPINAVEDTHVFWTRWAGRCTYEGEWRDEVLRSLITLKALTFLPTGGIVAAPTTSLPEKIGGVRNWDYRYCWVRDASFTLNALMSSGYEAEAQAWCEWLLRAVAGHPAHFQIMYGVRGERRLPELELPWLPGYEGSAPVRIGNAASTQLQLDTFGEVMNCIHHARRLGVPLSQQTWAFQRALVDYLEQHWQDPDEGIWEVRGPRRHFTHSKVMAWVAVDRAIKEAEHLGLPAPLERWRQTRDQIHREVCERGYHPRRGAFTQFYGCEALDSSLLRMPLVGFLPAEDPRIASTIEAIRRELTEESGLLLRYHPDEDTEALPHDEGTFLACTAWMADCLALLGRRAEARALFERLLALRNDVGLLSEEHDAKLGRLLGNFPQALSHVAIVNTAYYLSRKDIGHDEQHETRAA